MVGYKVDRGKNFITKAELFIIFHVYHHVIHKKRKDEF